MLAFYVLLSGLGLVCGESISLMPSDTSVSKYVNDSYFVTCTAPNSEFIVWTKGTTKEINHNSKGVHTEDTQDPGSLLLVFEGIRKKDKGDYICRAKYSTSILDQKFTLNPINPISFAKSNDIQSAPEGSNYTIRCDVSGDGNVTIKLRTYEARHKALKYQQSPEGFLQIENVTMDYGGKYRCSAEQFSSKLSDWKESDIYLKIQHKPRWTNAVEKFVGFVGGTVNLTCSALAEPGAQFTWIKNNNTLHNNEFVKISNSDHHSALEMYISDESVFGGYQCRATNTLGTMARIVYLEEASIPYAPRFEILETGGTNMILRIVESAVEVKDKSIVETSGYVVQFKRPGGEWSTKNQQEFEISRGNTYSLANLDLDTTYEVRAATRTAAGPGRFAEARKATTKNSMATASSMGTNGSNHDSFSSYFHQWVLTALIAALLAVNICV